MRDDYLRSALAVVDEPMVLINLVSRRVKQLRRGQRPLVESLEKLSAEDTALREIAEGKITFELGADDESAPWHASSVWKFKPDGTPATSGAASAPAKA
jgi:DNA-directed RNA polymerase subunit omega